MSTKVINHGCGAFYGLGTIGAFVYYMQNAHSAAEILLGIIKTIIWPALLIHRLLEYLGM